MAARNPQGQTAKYFSWGVINRSLSCPRSNDIHGSAFNERRQPWAVFAI